jgi:hypothetical protein
LPLWQREPNSFYSRKLRLLARICAADKRS